MSAALRGLVDDAGLFPPTALPMDAALRRHIADVDQAHPVHTNRFLCPASRLVELTGLLPADRRIRLGLICDTGLDGLPAALHAVEDDPRLALAVLEFPLAKTGLDDPAPALAAVLAATPAETPLFVEPVTLADAATLADVIAGRGDGRPVGLKARCGGVRAELFPSAESLSRFILVVAGAGVPMKATAGLHRAVRYRDQATGFVHHGFLNILAAVVRAVAGDEERAVEETLLVTDAPTLTAAIGDAGETVLARARAIFTSYGSCSTATPLAEIGRLGLLAD